MKLESIKAETLRDVKVDKYRGNDNQPLDTKPRKTYS